MTKNIIILVLAFLSIGYAQASCVELRENSEITLSTASRSNGEVCIQLRDLHSTETYFSADNLTAGLNSVAAAGYTATLQLGNGTVIYSKTLLSEPDIIKVALQHHDRAILKLKKSPNGNNLDYSFHIINNREIQGLSTITVTASAKAKSNAAQLPPPDGGCEYVNGSKTCYRPYSAPISAPMHSVYSSGAVSLGQVTLPNAIQCKSTNRPPSPAPYKNDKSGTEMKINDILRTEISWRNKARWLLAVNAVAYPAITHQRLYSLLRTNGVYDVKSDESPWQGDADFGNFLYGTIMQAHGFSGDLALRYSAGYQAIQDHNNKFTYASVTQGIYNFITNTGDGAGDPEMVMRGFNYAKEVFSKNSQDTKSLSCIDEQTISQQATSGGGGGSNDGGGNPGGGSGGGRVIRATCNLWYFKSGIANGQYYMNTCKFHSSP